MPNKRRETAVSAGDHALAADNIGELADALSDEFRMLDVVRAGVDHAGDQNLVVRNPGIAPDRPLMRMPRICRLERNRLRLAPQNDWQDLLQGNVEIVRPLVVAPAQVQ